MTAAAILAFLESFSKLAASPEGQAVIHLALDKTNFPVDQVAAHAAALKPAPDVNTKG